VPLGRFIVFGNDLTLRGPVIGRNPVYNAGNPTDPASDFKAFTDADRFNFGPFNYLQIPVERYGAFINARQEISDSINFSVRGIWNQRKSKNQLRRCPSDSAPPRG
jgi:iron complex outermembrane receptor protein